MRSRCSQRAGCSVGNAGSAAPAGERLGTCCPCPSRLRPPTTVSREDWCLTGRPGAGSALTRTTITVGTAVAAFGL